MADIIWDPRPLYVFSQIPRDQYEIIDSRYQQFLENLNDVKTDPVTVFNPLKQNQLDELKLIREITEVLQQKKVEDVKKSQSAAEEVKQAQSEQKDTDVQEEKQKTKEV